MNEPCHPFTFLLFGLIEKMFQNPTPAVFKRAKNRNYFCKNLVEKLLYYSQIEQHPHHISKLVNAFQRYLIPLKTLKLTYKVLVVPEQKCKATNLVLLLLDL